MFRLRLVALLLASLYGPSLLPAQATQELAPGVAVPASGTVFALDKTARESTSLVQFHPSEIVSNSHAPGNLARSAVYIGARSSIELAGINAAVHLESGDTSVFFRLSTDDPEILRKRVTLIRLKQDRDRRIVSSYSQNIFGGQRSRKYDEIAVVKTDVADGQWLKLTPEVPLPPGEYGIVVLPKDTNLFADIVYDFDVDLNAAKDDTK